MTVLNGDGLVGRVVRVGQRTAAVVQLLIDATSTVGARLEGSHASSALLNGTGDARPRWSSSCSTSSRGRGRATGW